MTSYGVMIAVITFVFAVLVMFFIERLVLSRLRGLSTGIDRIIVGKDFSRRLAVDNKDEFGNLAQNLNLLLSALENLQVERHERQLIDIVDGVLNGCLVFFGIGWSTSIRSR